MQRVLPLLVWLWAAPAAAQLYGPEVLAEVRRSQPVLTQMLTRDIPATLPRGERARAAAIRPAFPDRMGGHPLAMFAEPARGIVHIPLETIRFLDDYALLLGWDNAFNCESEFFETYLHALLRQGRDLPPPLAAFGLDREAAIANPRVDTVGQGILKSAVFFLLSHEIGHILLGHDPAATGAASRRQEMEADAFALDRFAALGTAPSGMAAYFYAARYLDRTGEAQHFSTHPVFSERMAAIGARLAADPVAFSFSEADPAAARVGVLTVAAEFERLAALGEDEALLEVLPELLHRDWPLSRLTEACPR